MDHMHFWGENGLANFLDTPDQIGILVVGKWERFIEAADTIESMFAISSITCWHRGEPGRQDLHLVS